MTTRSDKEDRYGSAVRITAVIKILERAIAAMRLIQSDLGLTNRDAERAAFRAGFLSIVVPERQEAGKPYTWRFDRRSGADLEPHAWEAYQRSKGKR